MRGKVGGLWGLVACPQYFSSLCSCNCAPFWGLAGVGKSVNNQLRTMHKAESME